MTAPLVGRGHVLWVKAWWRGKRGKWIPVLEAITLNSGWSAKRLLSDGREGSIIEYKILSSGTRPSGMGLEEYKRLMNPREKSA